MITLASSNFHLPILSRDYYITCTNKVKADFTGCQKKNQTKTKTKKKPTILGQKEEM